MALSQSPAPATGGSLSLLITGRAMPLLGHFPRAAQPTSQISYSGIQLLYIAPRDSSLPTVAALSSAKSSPISYAHVLPSTDWLLPIISGPTTLLSDLTGPLVSCYGNVSPVHKDWDVVLPYVTFTYNSSHHNTAGYSPFDLLFGRDPVLPLDTSLPLLRDSRQYVRDAIAHAEHVHQLARTRLVASQETQRHAYSRCHRDVYFSPGSLVLLWSPCCRVGLSETESPAFVLQRPLPRST